MYHNMAFISKCCLVYHSGVFMSSARRILISF
jgi:hypothetical protein